MKNFIKREWLAPGLVFIAIMLVVLVSFFSTNAATQRELDTRVNEYSSLTSDLISDRLRINEEFLWAAAGVFNSFEIVSREHWSNFVEQSSVRERYPGAQGIGFAPVVQRSDLNSFVAEQREELPNFRVYPTGQREFYTPTLFLEPDTELNRSAIGFDMSTEPQRRRAMELSRDQNEAFITRPVQISVGDGQEDQIGFLLYVPVYQNGQPTSNVEQRQQNIDGYVYSVFLASDFFSNALARQQDDNFSYQIHFEDQLLYEEDGFQALIADGANTREIVSFIQEVEYKITYAYRANNILPESIRTQPATVFMIGLIAAIFSAFITWLLLSNRQNELLLEKERDINEAKDNLLSIASHQLRTPATGVKQYLGMVMQGLAGDVNVKQLSFLEKAYESNERQLKIINDILYLARLESGRIVLSKTKIKLRDTISSLVEEMRDSIEESEHIVKVKAPNQAVYIWADEHMVRMIIENLLTNAIKYTPNGGKISIQIKRTRGGAKIVVKDSGVGITPEQHDKVFEQFTRVQNSLTKSVSGSGVGLYLTKQLVTMHEGTISFMSEEGKGTTFIVFLPTNKPKTKK